MAVHVEVGRMDHAHRPKECVLQHCSSEKLKKVPPFCDGDKVFQCKALPFGLSTAPLVFMWVMNVIAPYAHIHGVQVHMYLDDLGL